LIVHGVDILFSAVVPEQNCLVDFAVDLHCDLLVALADGGCLKFGNTLLEIGATIAAEIGSLGRLCHEDRRSHHTRQGSDRHKAGGPPQSPGHDPSNSVLSDAINDERLFPVAAQSPCIWRSVLPTSGR
jgi:hypothetical protein